MKDKHNGKEPPKILNFPTLAERDRLRREKQAEEDQRRKEFRARNPNPPFLNTGKIPPFTRALVLAILSVHIFLLFVDEATRLQIYYAFGFVPGYYTGAMDVFPLSALAAPLTHMLIHSGWMHLLFNIVMALALGMFFEKQYGARVTALFFLICGLMGALTFFALNPHATYPMIGASGGISGLFAALILTIGRQNGGRFGPWPLLGFWLLFMIGTGFLGSPDGGNTAWQAHVGGFVAGIILVLLMQKFRLKF